jgi:hypothetical protein
MVKSHRSENLLSGGMAEWTKAAVLKTAVGVKAHRGFESLSLRLINLPGEVPEWLIGAAC